MIGSARDRHSRYVKIANSSRRGKENAESAEEERQAILDSYPCFFRLIRAIRDKAVHRSRPLLLFSAPSAALLLFSA